MQADLISRPSISSAKTLFPNRATIRALGVMRQTCLLESVFNPVGSCPFQLRHRRAKAARGPEPMREEAGGQKRTRGVQTRAGDEEFAARGGSEPGARELLLPVGVGLREGRALL